MPDFTHATAALPPPMPIPFPMANAPPPPQPPQLVVEPEVVTLRFISQGGRAYDVSAHLSPGMDMPGMAQQLQTSMSNLEMMHGDRATILVGSLVLRVSDIESTEVKSYVHTPG